MFPIAPRPAFNYAILACFSQPPNSQSLIFRTAHSAFPHTAFPTTKRHLSTRDSCPFEAPSLTFRISIPKLSQPDTCPTPQSRLPIRHPKRPKTAFPPSVFPKIPTQDLHQKFLFWVSAFPPCLAKDPSPSVAHQRTETQCSSRTRSKREHRLVLRLTANNRKSHLVPTTFGCGAFQGVLRG